MVCEQADNKADVVPCDRLQAIDFPQPELPGLFPDCKRRKQAVGRGREMGQGFALPLAFPRFSVYHRMFMGRRN
jgi:hypothetical protein